jgi:hypothetical protein
LVYFKYLASYNFQNGAEEQITHHTWADNTSSNCQDHVKQVVIKQLEEDAKSMLDFIALYGLEAYPSKMCL